MKKLLNLINAKTAIILFLLSVVSWLSGIFVPYEWEGVSGGLFSLFFYLSIITAVVAFVRAALKK